MLYIKLNFKILIKNFLDFKLKLNRQYIHVNVGAEYIMHTLLEKGCCAASPFRSFSFDEFSVVVNSSSVIAW